MQSPKFKWLIGMSFVLAYTLPIKPNRDEEIQTAHKELKELYGDGYSTEKSDLDLHASTTHTYHSSRSEMNSPFAVVYPVSTQQVQQTVAICSRYSIPIVPYGSGTSLEGHTTTVKSGICMDFSKMDNIKNINVEDMDCVVEPGITWNTLNQELKKYGLFFPVDPGPGASIGGMVATGCSGTNAVRYGTMKNNVVNLTVVTSDGKVIKTAQRARKSAAGYDLTRLFVGSEGTFGIVTEITLRLQNLPEHTAVAVCNFPSVKDAANSVIEMMQKGIRIGCVELLDDVMMKGVNQYSGLNYEEKPTLFLKFHGTKISVEDEISQVSKIVSLHKAGKFKWAGSETEREKLWEARKGALWAANTLRMNSKAWVTDVCVPISKLAECIEQTKEDLKKSRFPAPIVGHVGDGNFHVLMMIDPNDQRDYQEAVLLNRRMVERAIAMEGTCTGEHGIGIGKKPYLVKELGVDTVNYMKRIKRALDPKNIMNPNKIIEIDEID